MKLMTFAELAAMPEGTIYECDFGPAHHTPGMYRKGITWDEDDEDGAGISTLNLSYLIESGDDPATATPDFLTESSGEDYQFRVYESADLDRLAELIGRGSVRRDA